MDDELLFLTFLSKRRRQMATTIRLRGGVVILEPNGKLIGTAVSELREKLAAQLEASNAACILINFEDVNQMDSSGLGMLVNTRAVAAWKKSRIGIINVEKRIRNLLVLSRLVSLFKYFDTEAAAIAAFNREQRTFPMQLKKSTI
ncbi:STAS domain-containing protein [Candidatus Poribacteria bacterium]|nr:STAS domain-containing protein [Candidatus Poribacteria bacterium]